ncbi:hypothetical protein ACWE42_08640 [Sutcliffiella cohnii]
MKKSYFIIVSLLTMIMLTGCLNLSGEEGVSELRIAHNQTLDHPVHLSLVEFSRLVEENSNGNIKVKIFPNAQLGSERECASSIIHLVILVLSLNPKYLELKIFNLSIF